MRYQLLHKHRLLQKMSLTPQMRQSIALLGMSAADLSEYIEAALAKNPFLQKLEEMRDANRHKTNAPSSAASDLDRQDALKAQTNPRDSLLLQAKMLGMDEGLSTIAEYLIYEMDDNGYLNIDTEEAAGDLGVEAEDVERCLEMIQSMDPPGIGARDLKECLQIQLKRSGKENSLEYMIVTGYLTEVARGDIAKISSGLKSDERGVKRAIDAIKALNPKPAGSVLGKEPEHVTPDIVARVKEADIHLEINRGVLPQLRLYNPYEHDFNIVKDPEARKFMKENMDFAKGLIDGVSRREDTLCKVAGYILKVQKESCLKPGHHIKTLTMQDVAKALNFHPSTVSRAISNKHVRINDKTMPLAGFLSHGVKHRDGETISKTALKEKMRAMVKTEDTAHPLSDGEIRKKLCEDGFSIERRTVAKYRHALRILPVSLRRRRSTPK